MTATPPNATVGNTSFSASQSNLLPGTTYTFHAVATGTVAPVKGNDLTFATVHHADANGDGVINVLDMTEVAREILKLDTITPGADANLDGAVDVLDMTKIARIILLLNPY